MRIGVFRNFKALHFIRCVATVPGSDIRVGGAGFTLHQALSKCESEAIEREFEVQELRPLALIPLGIASHPTRDGARARALQEMIETLCLREVHREKRIRCIFRIRFRSFAIGVARTSHGYFCLIRGKGADRMVGSHAAAPKFLSAVIKAWEEYQSMQFFRPKGRDLAEYMKANQLFSSDELAQIPFEREPGFVYRPDLQGTKEHSVERSGRPVVYYLKQGENTR